MTKLSIITINYNNKEGLEKTIKSVVNQTYEDFEYIVIDGGSSDGSIDVIKDYEDKINFWVSEPDKGIYNAINKGILASRGEYLLFLNGDDVLLHNTVLKDKSHYLDGKDLIYFDVETIDDKGKNRIGYPDQLSFYFFYTTTICHQAIFFKKELFSKYGFFDEKLKIVSDWKFIMLAIVKYNATYLHVNDVFCLFDSRGISCPSEANNIHALLHIEERHEVLAKEFPLFTSDYFEYQMLKMYFSKYKLNSIKKSIVFFKSKLVFWK